MVAGVSVGTGAALAAAGGSLLNTGLSSVFANSANKKSKNAALTQFWMQNYFMNKQNEYNKPINQMARLREAGLNPNLVYGNGAGSLESASPSGGAMAKVTPAHVSDFDALGMMLAKGQVEHQFLENENLEYNSKNIANQIWLDQKNMKLRELLTAAQVFNLLQTGKRTKLDNDFYEWANNYLGNSGGAGVNALKTVAALGSMFMRK